MAWLENHVVTDVAYDMTEAMVWECLWDESRKLTKDEMEELDKEFGKKEEDASVMKVLRKNYTKPLSPEGGQPLLQNQWNQLVYYLNKLMQRGSLVENYAIKKMQEQIITQARANYCNVPKCIAKLASWAHTFAIDWVFVDL